MRIVHVVAAAAPGGVEQAFLDVLRHVRAEDPAIDHHVVALADASPLPECDVVHVVSERVAYRLLPGLLARSATPVVYSKGYDMGGMSRLNDGLRWQADESMLAACDAVTFTTSHLASGYDLPVGRTTILGKAADVTRFHAIPAPPPPSTPQRVVCVARIEPRHRLGDLVQALADVRRELPAAELRLVGGGYDEEARRLLALAETLGIADAVSLSGDVADYASEFEEARIVALPSACEGVPTVLLEGMAAGRPVVATTVGHVASIIDRGVEGFLVHPGDVQSLADCLTRLLLDPDLAAGMGLAARTRSASHDDRAVASRLLRALRAAA